MRKVFLDDLPRWKSGTNKGKINWKESVGYKVKFVYDDTEGEMQIVGYDGKHLTVEYNGKEFKVFTRGLCEGKIGAAIGRFTKEFKVEVGDSFDDLIITDREYRDLEHKPDKKGRVYIQKRKWYKYTCNKCGWTEGWIEESNLLNKKRCSCCKGLTNVPNINSIVAKPETHWMIPYFQGGHDEAKLYTPQSNQKVKFKCPDCGRVKEKDKRIGDLYKNHSIGCSCSDGITYPNKFLRYLVYQLKEIYNIEYEFEYKIENRSYDGYVEYNGKDYLIEMDGVQHKNNCFGNDDIENDKYKNELALENNYNLIRIDCENSNMDFIKDNILSSQLNNIFDLSKINWLKIDKESLKNTVKKVCEYWDNKKEEENTEDLAKVFDLARSTIIRYLKEGVRHDDWCRYDTKEEKIKRSIRLGKVNGKQIEIFKNGLSLGIFESCSELERQSKELFGVKLHHNNISQVANGKQKQHKDFTFKYIKSEEEITTPNILCNDNNQTTTYSV